MISLFAPWTWCSSDAESWVFTMMAYWVQGFRGRMRYPGSILSLSPSEERCGGSTSAITQLLEPQASCPSNSVTFWKGLLEGTKIKSNQIKWQKMNIRGRKTSFELQYGDGRCIPNVYKIQPPICVLQVFSIGVVGSSITSLTYSCLF